MFMAGMEEGLFPHQKIHRRARTVGRRAPSLLRRHDPGDAAALHQPRRVPHAAWPDQFFSRPSRFLSEIPEELVENLRPGGRVQPARSGPEPSTAGLSLGSQVRHARFGLGTVVSIEGQGPNARVQINFEAAGSKWLVLGYAALEPVT